MRALVKAGARDFFAAHWSEVLPLLEYAPARQISVLHGVLTAEEAAFARETGVRPVINSVAQAKLWSASGGGACDLMIDSGINRLGIAPGDIDDPAIQALDVNVLMSHLACADEDSPRNAAQLEVFLRAREAIAHKEASLANSAGIALGDNYAFDLTRPGLALYGGIARSEFGTVIKQVAFPEAAIIQVRPISAGEKVGYNGMFTAPKAMRIGVVSLGYADGILRNWTQDFGYFTRGESKLPMLGKVSMDMIVVDLSEADDIREGDWVQLPYKLKNAAQQTGLSQYELLTVLGRRFS
jgi:alanine racemase